MIRRTAFLVALVLLLAFGAWRQQSAPVTVVCGSVSGGQMVTAKGVDWAQRAGAWIRNVADNPDEYRERESIKETLDGMFRKVLWYWIKTGVQSARGEKIDPAIIKLQKEAEQARMDALAACCPPPQVDTEEPAEPPADEPFNPKDASLSNARGFSGENIRIARIAAREAEKAGLGKDALVIAITASMQESGPNGPRNLSHGHASSVGPWQLISAHGSFKQRMDPAFQARWFFRQLKGVKGWQALSVNDAAQAVERSGHPDRYGRWEKDARELVRVAVGDAPLKPRVDDSGPVPNITPCVPDGESSSDPTARKPGTPAAPISIESPNRKVTMDGKFISAITAAQIEFVEAKTGKNLRIMQGGYGGAHYGPSGTSHNYPGSVDIACADASDCISVETAMRKGAFAAWARNVPGRSTAGSGAHVHGISLLDQGSTDAPQVRWSWPNKGNGLTGSHNDPAPHPPWYPDLLRGKSA